MAKGHKTGGREAGTPNRLTNEIREILCDIMHKELKDLPRRLNELETKDRLELLAKFIPYVIPRMEAPKGQLDSDPIIINIPPNI
jgi:hypothetical protein